MKRKTTKMNVYMILPTTHLDELLRVKLRRAFKNHTTQPVVQTGLEFWIADPGDREEGITGIAVLASHGIDITKLLNVCAGTRISPHLVCTADEPPAQYFSAIDVKQANEWLLEP